MTIYLLRNQIPQNKKANIKRSSIASDQIGNILDANNVDDDSEEKRETLIKKIRKVRPKSAGRNSNDKVKTTFYSKLDNVTKKINEYATTFVLIDYFKY